VVGHLDVEGPRPWPGTRSSVGPITVETVSPAASSSMTRSCTFRAVRPKSLCTEPSSRERPEGPGLATHSTRKSWSGCAGAPSNNAAKAGSSSWPSAARAAPGIPIMNPVNSDTATTRHALPFI
jgi:hypothetical protein